jgi:hypothetical protein
MNISSFKTESNMLSLYRFSLVTVTILSNGLTSQWVYASPAPLEQSKTMEYQQNQKIRQSHLRHKPAQVSRQMSQDSLVTTQFSNVTQMKFQNQL